MKLFNYQEIILYLLKIFNFLTQNLFNIFKLLVLFHHLNFKVLIILKRFYENHL
jgi:hypothetical protein